MINKGILGSVVVGLLVTACVADGEMFFGAPYTDAASVTGGGTLDTSSSSNGMGGMTSSSDVTTSTVSSTGGTTVVSSTSVASSTGTGPTTVVVAASSSTGMPMQNTITCGSNLTCNVDKGEACCWDNLNLLDGPQNKCVTGPLDNDGCNTLQVGFGPETRINCQDESDCGAEQVCCARRKQFFANGKQYSVYDQVACENNCSLDKNNQKFVICVPNVTQCPLLPTDKNQWVQSVCKESQLLPSGYYVCGYP